MATISTSFVLATLLIYNKMPYKYMGRTYMLMSWTNLLKYLPLMKNSGKKFLCLRRHINMRNINFLPKHGPFM